MLKLLVFFVIAGLVIVAGFLGYKIYQQSGLNIPFLNTQTAYKSTTPTAGNTPAAPQPKTLTADEQAALKFPSASASKAEIKAHSDLVNKLGDASGTPFLDITGCKPSPIVYRVHPGGSFKVKNSDKIDHTIYTDATRKTTVKAGSDQTVSSKAIGDNMGDFGYNCDNSTAVVGIIQIVP